MDTITFATNIKQYKFNYNVKQFDDDFKWNIQVTAPEKLSLVMIVRDTNPTPTGGGIIWYLKLDTDSYNKLYELFIELHLTPKDFDILKKDMEMNIRNRVIGASKFLN